jgi:RNA-binding protein
MAQNDNLYKPLNKDTSLDQLKGFQKTFLKGLAHSKKPVIFIRKNGLTPDVIKALAKSLDDHELIKEE